VSETILALCHCGSLYAQHTWEQMAACAANDPEAVHDE
jgi:hypothetical protein